jgi:hypothetical protein
MNRKSDEQYLSELRELFTTPRAASALSSRLQPVSSVGNWLGNLRLLVGVPFTNLFANNRMLPRESIRFFYVDDNWLDALQDGATSIGLHSSLDAEHQRTMKETLVREAEIGAQQQRRRRRKQPLATSVMTGTVRTGFLLRSAVVSGWPGLEVRAFADRQGTQPIELLRLERLAPDVMICIISGERGIPARIDIDEPSEGLQFGVVLRSGEKELLDWAIAPRWPGFTQPDKTGEVITKDPNCWVPPVMRQKSGQDTRVLDVIASRAELKSRLILLKAMTQDQELESADFALQMVKSPAQQPFSADPAIPLAKELASAPDMIEIERLPAIDEDAVFQELFRS